VGRDLDWLLRVVQETSGQCQAARVGFDAAFHQQQLQTCSAERKDHQIDCEKHRGGLPFIVGHTSIVTSCQNDKKSRGGY
jgi:hypothetical protein